MTNNEKTSPHIGDMLKQYVKQRRIYKAGWARHQNVQWKTVAGYLKKPSIQTKTLFAICHVLKYNFFADLAATLPPEYPHSPTTQDEKNLQLEKENEKLRIEIGVLREVVKKV